jgi:hypothetical protein
VRLTLVRDATLVRGRHAADVRAVRAATEAGVHVPDDGGTIEL